MKKSTAEVIPESSLYDADFFEWTQSAARDLREGRLSTEDLRHIAEEIEDMGKRDRRELYSRMIVLLTHLMKWAAQPERRESSTWMGTINEQRTQIQLNLQDSPSLRRYAIDTLPKIYSKAAATAARETRLSASTFARPSRLYADLDPLLSDDWYPENIDDLFR